MIKFLGKENVNFEVSGNIPYFTGTYTISDEVIRRAPNNPVWKKGGKDAYIFNNGSEEGWIIGNKENFEDPDGAYYFKCKLYHLLGST